MKKGTKITLFLASMALTVGSLVAFVGPRHCGYGMNRHASWTNDHPRNCAPWNANAADGATTR